MDRSELNLVQAVPAIERLVRNNPDLDDRGYAQEAAKLAEAFQLDKSAASLVEGALSRYEADRRAIWQYYGLISGEPVPQRGKNPIAAIDADVLLKIAALTDFGINRDKLVEGALDKFLFDQCLPSAFITHFSGRSRELGALYEDAQEGAGIRDASGFYVQSFRPKEGEFPQRAELLSGRVLFVTHPDQEEQRRLIGSPEQTKEHEIRHYLFHLFWGLTHDHDINDHVIAASVMDEMQALVSSGRECVQLDHLFPRELSGDSGQKRPILLCEHPQAMEQVIDFLYEVERTTGLASVAHDLVADTILTSPGLLDAAKRLSMLGTEVSAFDVYRSLLRATTPYRDSDDDRLINAANSSVFLRAVTSRVLDLHAQGFATSEDVTSFADHLAYRLERQLFMSVSLDGPINQAGDFIEELHGYKKRFRELGVAEEWLENVLQEAHARLEEIQDVRIRRNSWADFKWFLLDEHPSIAAKLEHNAGKRTIGDLLTQFRQNQVEPLYKQWIQGKEQRYLW